MKQIVAIYIRLAPSEIDRLREKPEILPLYDPRVALADGRGLDLGQGWDELGAYLEGGITIPETGPTVGEEVLPDLDPRARWSYVVPERVAAIARQLMRYTRREFFRSFKTDTDETQDFVRDEQSGTIGDRASYMFQKLRTLARHYSAAAECGEAMLVRIGERV